VVNVFAEGSVWLMKGVVYQNTATDFLCRGVGMMVDASSGQVPSSDTLVSQADVLSAI